MTVGTVVVLIIGTLVASAVPLVFLPLFRRARSRRWERLHSEVGGRPFDPTETVLVRRMEAIAQDVREMQERLASLSRTLEEHKVAH